MFSVFHTHFYTNLGHLLVHSLVARSVASLRFIFLEFRIILIYSEFGVTCISNCWWWPPAANGIRLWCTASANIKWSEKNPCRNKIMCTTPWWGVRELIDGQQIQIRGIEFKRNWANALDAEHRVLLPIRWHWERIVTSCCFFHFFCSAFLLAAIDFFLFSYSLLCHTKWREKIEKR